MTDKNMEVLSRGRYEEVESVSHPPSATPGLSQSLSMTRLPSAEPYFVLSEDMDNQSLEDTHLSSSSEDNEVDKIAVSSLRSRIEAASTAEDSKEDKKGGGGIAADGFYSWAKGHSGPLDQLLKSYISAHYGMNPTKDTTENNSDDDEISDDELLGTADLSNSNIDDCESEQLIRSVSQSLASEGSSTRGELADPSTVRRFSDSQTQLAYEKMLMLDDRLTKAAKREREVKRRRRKLHKKMQEEGITLALGSGPAGTDDVRSCVSPLFPTQPAESQQYLKKKQAESASEGLGGNRDQCGEEKSPGSEVEAKTTQKPKKTDGQESVGRNFIRRNIELASDAGSLVKMTPTEKQRLKELVGSDQEEEEEEMEQTEDHVLEDEDRAAVSVLPTLTDKPFSLDSTSVLRLNEIQSKLDSLSAGKAAANAISYNTPSGNAGLSTDLVAVSPSMSHTEEHIGPDNARMQLHHEAQEEENGQRGERCEDKNVCGKFQGRSQRSADNKNQVENCSNEASVRGLDLEGVGEEGGACNEGDVVLECVEKGVNDGGDDDDCDYVCEDNGVCGNIESEVHSSKGVWCTGPLSDQCISTSSSGASLAAANNSRHVVQSNFTSASILARECMSLEERSKMSVLDERLRSLQEETDSDYISKKPLSTEQLKWLLTQCSMESGATGQ